MTLVVIGMMGACFFVSWLLTGAVRKYALHTSVLDVPNIRSSHFAPTPRGGGLAIAIVLLVVISLAAMLDTIPSSFALAIVGGGSLIAYIGWIDDRGHVSALWRSLVQITAAAWALYWLGGLPVIELGGAELRLGGWGSVLGAVGIVWLTNLQLYGWN